MEIDVKRFGIGFEGINKTFSIILDSSMVEHSAVNRVVVGSSPTRGVFPYQEKEENKAPWSSG